MGVVSGFAHGRRAGGSRALDSATRTLARKATISGRDRAAFGVALAVVVDAQLAAIASGALDFTCVTSAGVASVLEARPVRVDRAVPVARTVHGAADADALHLTALAAATATGSGIGYWLAVRVGDACHVAAAPRYRIGLDYDARFGHRSGFRLRRGLGFYTRLRRGFRLYIRLRLRRGFRFRHGLRFPLGARLGLTPRVAHRSTLAWVAIVALRASARDHGQDQRQPRDAQAEAHTDPLRLTLRLW
jgi:hypothetical protein